MISSETQISNTELEYQLLVYQFMKSYKLIQSYLIEEEISDTNKDYINVNIILNNR